ncbi:MAG: energy transducer TonB [Ginsengibacter sp.]
MITLAWYLLKVTICSGILSGYYFLALRNKVFHRWNRFYLLAAVAISLLAPIIKIDILQNNEDKGTVVQMLQTISYGDQAVIEYSKNTGFQLSTENLAEAAYLLISIILLTMFFASLFKIKSLRKKFPSTRIKDVRFINTNANGTPFSFFKSIFWNDAIDLHSRSGQQIFNHEIAHIKEKHSHDKMFMNAVLIFLWINPFFWLMRKELYMIHEFIADKEALEDGDINAFAEMILQTVYPGQNFSGTNNFFYSPLKRRIMMLTKNKNPKVNYVSRLLVLPLATIVFFAFTLKIYPSDQIDAHDSKIITAVMDAGNRGVDNDPLANLLNEKNIALLNKLTSSTDKRDTIPRISSASKIKPLYLLNGTSITGKESQKIPPENIESITVLKGDSAILQYGKKGKNGVIEIVTKDKNSSVAIVNSGKNRPSGIADNALVIIDGKEIRNGEIKNIDPNKIESISVLKGESAALKYGTKGKNGVVEIHLKPFDVKPITGIQKDTIPDKVFTKTEIPASFPGGQAEWIKYITGKIKASIDTFTNADYGTCVVRFIVNTDGTVSDVQATTMKGTRFAQISVNAIKKGPRWIPASQNGHAVAAYRLQPVTLTNPEKPNTSEKSTTGNSSEDQRKIFIKLEQPAGFPGGQSAWLAYINRVFQKNGNALMENKNNQGTCQVRFIVNVDGSVSDVQAITMQGTELDNVALNPIKKGPNCIPVKQNGHAVNSFVTVPVTLKLNDNIGIKNEPN